MPRTSALRTRLESLVVRALAGLPHGLLRVLVGRPVTIDGQELHVEVQLVLKLLALAGDPPLESSRRLAWHRRGFRLPMTREASKGRSLRSRASRRSPWLARPGRWVVAGLSMRGLLFAAGDA